MLTRPVATLIRNQVLLTLPPQATVRVACQRMRERYVGSVLVTDERDHLLGIFTERDAVCRILAESRDADRTTLAEVMTADVVTVPPQAMALEALRLMQDGGFRHVPVVAARRLVGIVSFTDFRGMEHARLEEETQLFETVR
ncbi:MAG: cyclic nucleotide-binding/CBS domain-containing protein [Geminicoccaceae bacterium]